VYIAQINFEITIYPLNPHKFTLPLLSPLLRPVWKHSNDKWALMTAFKTGLKAFEQEMSSNDAY